MVFDELWVYSEEFNLVGKIDRYDKKNQIIIERKTKINKVYPNQIMQLWAYYFCAVESNYPVQKLVLYSIDDNKKYQIPLPTQQDKEKFKEIIDRIQKFDIETFYSDCDLPSTNIYSELC